MSLLSKPKHPAYHLRPNKAIDRSIFLEMLKTLECYRSLDKYIYIGLGGPYLEDFRLIAKEYPSINMISIEQDKETLKRQEFHKCAKNLALHEGTFEQFLSSDYPSDIPTITWIDFIDFTREVLSQISDISRKSVPLSMLRITVMAETPVYYKLNLNRKMLKLPLKKKNDFEVFVKSFISKIQIEGVAYDDSKFTWDNFSENEYPSLLANIIVSVINAASTTPKVFVPLHTVKYSDGTIMLSVTGIFCNQEEKEKIKKHFEVRFPFYSDKGDTVETIDVPFLSTKERLHLEREIPVDSITGEKSIEQMKYLIEGDDSGDDSKYKMAQYEKYYRLYPYFGKLVP